MAPYLRTVLLIALVGFIPARAMAGPIAIGDQVRFLHSDGALGGGPFHVDDITNGEGEDLVTFCLQRTQYLDYTSLFTVGGITDYTMTRPVPTTCRPKPVGFTRRSWPEISAAITPT